MLQRRFCLLPIAINGERDQNQHGDEDYYDSQLDDRDEDAKGDYQLLEQGDDQQDSADDGAAAG